MWKLLIVCAFAIFRNENRSSVAIKPSKMMGIFINLYRLPKAEKIDEIKDLLQEIEKARPKKVNLYKMTEDLAIIFLNTPEPYDNVKTIPYKMLFGNGVDKTAGDYSIGGFLPTSEIKTIVEWINRTRINDYNSFEKMYAKLSPAVKQTLLDIGSDDKKYLFEKYILPMTDLYFTALKEHNSIVFIGE